VAKLDIIQDAPTQKDNDKDIDRAIDAKIEGAEHSRLSPEDCLFCTHVSPSLELNLTHMSAAHSFFVPDAEYLIDITGLITYLGEKIAVGNMCIYCNSKSKEFRSLQAARKHMVDKSHCKIAYDAEDDRLELSDYYDFSSSYPDAPHQPKKKSRSKHNRDGSGEEEWEDVDQDGEAADEIKDVVSEDDADDHSEASDDLPESQITYGDTSFELVLPSGARIGHRSMRRYYAQRFFATPRAAEDPNSGAGLVRRLLADKNSALIPRKGGFGAFGMGTEVIRTRNAGEAREAGRHVREYRDQRRREEFKTKVGFINNAQKHYRCGVLSTCQLDADLGRSFLQGSTLAISSSLRPPTHYDYIEDNVYKTSLEPCAADENPNGGNK
jgi:pre-60S factor REI1